jgi:hypothetical protein
VTELLGWYGIQRYRRPNDADFIIIGVEIPVKNKKQTCMVCFLFYHFEFLIFIAK